MTGLNPVKSMSLKKLEPYLMMAISFIMIFISFFPFLYHLFNTPKNQVFTGAHNYPPDYLFYLSEIQSGLDNHLLYRNKFTTELPLIKPMATELHYTALGFLGRLIHLNNPAVLYHLARLVLAFSYFLVIYSFISLFFKKPLDRLAAFSLAVFSSSVPIIQDSKISVYLDDYTYLNAVDRTAFLPHHLLRNLCLYLLFFFLLKIKAREKKILTIFLFSIFIGFQLGLISPHHAIIFLFTALSFVFLSILKTKKVSRAKLLFLISTVISVLLGSCLLYLTFLSPVGKTIRAWEIEAHQLLRPMSVFLALGPVFFLSLPALLSKKTYQKKFLFLPILIFITLFLTLCPLEKYLPISHIRFLQIPLLPALAILAIQAIKTIFPLKKLQKPMMIIGIGFSLLLSFPSYWPSLQNQIAYPKKYPTNFFISQDEAKALAFINKNTFEKGNFIGDHFSGNLLPAFTNNRVFVGHLLNTYQYLEKMKVAEKFFKGEMTKEEVENLFTAYNLKYIWLGEREAGWGTNLTQTYPVLKLKTIFQNSSVTIYQTTTLIL